MTHAEFQFGEILISKLWALIYTEKTRKDPIRPEKTPGMTFLLFIYLLSIYLSETDR